ncbi:MAG: hypothetical protein QNK37_04500 [Acidobacteriota bacterium]|nr:hypothetical protein [Acidobacteriota bacterium]
MNISAKDIDSLLKLLRSEDTIIRDLEREGFLGREEKVQGGWRIMPAIFLYWISDEVLTDTSEGSVLQSLLGSSSSVVQSERKKVWSFIGELAKEGTKTLVKEGAKGLLIL